MKVAKCNCEQTESKEPELLTFEQIKKKEGVYKIDKIGMSADRFIVLCKEHSGNEVLHFWPNGDLCILISSWETGKFIRTSETLCVGLKDADGKWVE